MSFIGKKADIRIRNFEKTVNENVALHTGILIMLHLIVLLAILLFCDVKYEVSDDFVMELIASGAISGRSDAHLMFCSSILGGLLCALYQISSGISWYFWMQILLGFLACCAVSCFLAHKMEFRMSIWCTILIAVFFARDLYLLPQFTKTAAAAIAAGGFLFSWSLFQEQKKEVSLCGAILMIAGCLLRHNAIYIAGAYLFLFILAESIGLIRTDGKGAGGKLLRIYVRGGILLLVIFALRWCNNMSYRNDGEYRYYIEYSYARAMIVDYPVPDYSECAEELEAIGISENDYQLICSWSFGDQTVFSLEKMQEVLSVVEANRPQLFHSFFDVIRRFAGRGILWYPGTICCILLAVLRFLFSKKSLRLSLAAGAVTVLLMLYFIYIGHGVYRVEFGYLFAAALLLIWRMPEGACHVPKHAWYFLMSALIVCCSVKDYIPDHSYENLTDSEYRDYVDSVFDLSWDYIPEKYTRTVNKREIRPDFLEEVQAHPENLYLLDFNTTIQSLYFDFSPFESLEKGDFHNMIYLGGVTINHPSIRETLETWGIGDELPGLLKENVYFVSNTTSEAVLQFLQEHYDANVTMSLYKELGGYQIWSYSS